MNTIDNNLYLISDEAQPWDTYHNELYKKAWGILQVADEIRDVYLWILIAIGLPGNILTIITVAAMNRLCPAKFFIALLAALDTASLICKLIRHIEFVDSEGCKIVEFLIPYTATLANWIVVLICVERFFTVCFKDKKPLIFSLRNCYIAVAVLSTSLFIIICVAMRSAKYLSWHCAPPYDYSWSWIQIWYWINAFLYLFLPLTMIIPMTALMLRKLLGSKRNDILQQNDDPSESLVPAAGKSGLTEEELENNKRTFTVMICIAAMFFVILCLPSCVFYLSDRYHYDHLKNALWNLYNAIQFFLADSTHAINFFLYFLSARQFRAKLVDIFRYKLCRKHRYAPEERPALELASDRSLSSQEEMVC